MLLWLSKKCGSWRSLFFSGGLQYPSNVVQYPIHPGLLNFYRIHRAWGQLFFEHSKELAETYIRVSHWLDPDKVGPNNAPYTCWRVLGFGHMFSLYILFILFFICRIAFSTINRNKTYWIEPICVFCERTELSQFAYFVHSNYPKWEGKISIQW